MRISLLVISLSLLLGACAKEQVDWRYLVYDKTIKRVLYCPTEQECERIRKIYQEDK